jgi:hypothetical protein
MMTDNEKKLTAALKACANAMRKSREVGCTDHLDCCDDAGAFWHDALETADNLTKQAVQEEPPQSELQELKEVVDGHDIDIETMKREIKRLFHGMSLLPVVF